MERMDVERTNEDGGLPSSGWAGLRSVEASRPSEVDLERLDRMDAPELVRWAFETYGDRAAIGTSLQLSGAVLVDMAASTGLPFRVFTVDTLRLHPETYAAMDALERRYAIRLERYAPDPAKISRMVRDHGEYLFFDSRAKQEYCCQLRKVEPHARALQTLDVWLTGLRRDQSADRAQTRRAAWLEQDGRKILKLAPLAHWTQEQVRHYVEENNVPYNALYDQGYESIGCVICTTPIRAGEDLRAGRWRWYNILEEASKKECGIHVQGSGSGI